MNKHVMRIVFHASQIKGGLELMKRDGLALRAFDEREI